MALHEMFHIAANLEETSTLLSRAPEQEVAQQELRRVLDATHIEGLVPW